MKELIGRTIIGIKEMSNKDKRCNGYDGPHDHPITIILDNGVMIWAQQDEENNGPGTLVFEDQNGDGDYVKEV